MSADILKSLNPGETLFVKIIESLRLAPSLQHWDLTWGEPFLAITKDRKLWVRIFYEESAGITAERLIHEIKRLKTHIPKDGELCICVPRGWGLKADDLPKDEGLAAQLWNYDKRANGEIYASLSANSSIAIRSIPGFGNGLSESEEMADRLTREEVCELTEIGLSIKRFGLKKAS